MSNPETENNDNQAQSNSDDDIFAPDLDESQLAYLEKGERSEPLTKKYEGDN